MTRFAALVALGIFTGTAALAADPATGLWRTEPDRKDLTSLIRVSECGEALCGTIEKAFNPQGEEVTTPNVGKRLFWDLKPQGDGAYADGTVYVPLMDVTATAKAELNGDRLEVTGCKGPVCDGQTWTRVR